MNLLLLTLLTLIAFIVTMSFVFFVFLIIAINDKDSITISRSVISVPEYESPKFVTESTLKNNDDMSDHLRRHYLKEVLNSLAKPVILNSSHDSKINQAKYGDARSEHFTQHRHAVMKATAKIFPDNDVETNNQLPIEERFNAHEKEQQADTLNI